MLKIVDVCKRVEGHGKVKIYLDNKNEEIKQATFEIEAYRGFENILKHKKLFDIPKIISRICGLCHASQSIASCKTIENIYGIEPSEQSILLRKLLMTGELIKSHSLHFFFQAFPDLLSIFNIHQKTLSPYAIIKNYPQLTTIFFELIKIGNEIDKIFGGRAVHPITVIPGGVIYNPSKKNISLARKYFQKALMNLEVVIERFIELFSKKMPPEEFMIPNPIFLGMHNHGIFDRYSGILGFKEYNKKITNFIGKNYTNYFNKDSELNGIDFSIGNNILVGPLARNHIIESYDIEEISNFLSVFDKTWYKNILFTNFISLLEMYVEAFKALELLNEPLVNKKESLLSLTNIKNMDGIGVVEAPRGTLLHHYHLNKENSIDQIKLFIATEINIPLINHMITKYAQKLYEKTDIDTIKKEIQIIIRAFDPCISCATH